MKCSKCGNEKSEFFYNGNRGWYCRECVKFQAQKEMDREISEIDGEYTLNFNLTEKQKEISDKLSSIVMQGKSVLLEAVCGAGKTELVCKTISEQLNLGKKVGFAIPRRQVVLEIAERMKGIFRKMKVIAVCQGFTSVLKADLIVCTTHQLYRYYNYFDLLIIDEPDAFPFKGNNTLKGIASNATRGSVVYLTATPSDDLLDKVKKGDLEYLYLSKRPSGKPLTIPKVRYYTPSIIFVALFFHIVRLLKESRPLLLFVPTIDLGKRLEIVLGLVIKTCLITSQSKNKDEEICDFKNGKFKLAIATTVLERGITIYGVNVIIFKADHEIFDQSSLIQISGRVGRNVKDPKGECLFLSCGRSEAIDKCIERLERANDD